MHIFLNSFVLMSVDKRVFIAKTKNLTSLMYIKDQFLLRMKRDF